MGCEHLRDNPYTERYYCDACHVAALLQAQARGREEVLAGLRRCYGQDHVDHVLSEPGSPLTSPPPAAAPGSRVFAVANRHRLDLIRREVAGTLSPEEAEELTLLQAEMRALVDMMARPPAAAAPSREQILRLLARCERELERQP